MENAEFTRIATLLKGVCTPEDIFGELAGTREEKLAAARKTFLRIAKLVHPDAQSSEEEAQQAHASFKRLALFWEQAQERIDADVYGLKTNIPGFIPFTLRTGGGEYNVDALLTRGDLCNLYLGHVSSPTGYKRVLLKIPRHPQDNDLASNEARVLKHLRSGQDYQAARPFLSELLEAFTYEEQATGILRQVTVLAYTKGCVSLKEVKAAYPAGIDAKDMAWIWRRVLVALDFAHRNNVIHGAVLPTHILIQPEQHGVILLDWSYAVLHPQKTQTWIKAISADYRDWYPAEVFSRQVPQPGLDLFMAARCMLDLLGGDALHHTVPNSVPWQIQQHLRACTLSLPQRGSQDARLVLQEFDQLLERLWGPRTFHVFTMPRV